MWKERVQGKAQKTSFAPVGILRRTGPRHGDCPGQCDAFYRTSTRDTAAEPMTSPSSHPAFRVDRCRGSPEVHPSRAPPNRWTTRGSRARLMVDHLTKSLDRSTLEQSQVIRHPTGESPCQHIHRQLAASGLPQTPQRQPAPARWMRRRAVRRSDRNWRAAACSGQASAAASPWPGRSQVGKWPGGRPRAWLGQRGTCLLGGSAPQSPRMDSGGSEPPRLPPQDAGQPRGLPR